jgi:2'-5' RNA ligase
MEDALMRLGAYRREDRDFTPHVTLGRVKSDDVGRPLRDRLKEQADWVAGRQDIREVHVMSSETGPEGPTYTVLSREKLQGAGPPVE